VGQLARRGRVRGVRDQPDVDRRYRQRHCTSRAKSDPGDAHVLAEIVRLDRNHHRRVAGDSDASEAMKLVACSHQTMIWDRTRHVLRLRSALREYFPAAMDAFDDLDAPDALALLAVAPDPDRAARLSKSKISAALRQANRGNVEARTPRSRPWWGHRRCVNRPRCRPRSPSSPLVRSG
jgi:hypothetical protein